MSAANNTNNNFKPASAFKDANNDDNVHVPGALGKESYTSEPGTPHWLEAPTAPLVRKIEESAAQDAFRQAETTRSQGPSLVGEPAYSAITQLQETAKQQADAVVAEGQRTAEKARNSVEQTLPQVAAGAQSLLSGNTNQLQEGMKQTTDAAAEEGQRNVGKAKKSLARTGSEVLDSANRLQEEVKQKTDAAAAEGERDVETAKNSLVQTGAQLATGAKELVTNAVSTAQAYLPVTGGTGQQQARETSVTDGNNSQPGVVSSITSGATAAVDTTKQFLASAQKAVEPHVEYAKSVAQGYLGTSRTQPEETQAKPESEINNNVSRPRTTSNIPIGSGPRTPPVFPGA